MLIFVMFAGGRHISPAAMRNSKKRVGVYKWKVASTDLILCDMEHCLSWQTGTRHPKTVLECRIWAAKITKERVQVYPYVFCKLFLSFGNRSCILRLAGISLLLMSSIWTLCSTKAHLRIILDFTPLWLFFFKTENLQMGKCYWNH